MGVYFHGVSTYSLKYLLLVLGGGSYISEMMRLSCCLLSMDSFYALKKDSPSNLLMVYLTLVLS